MSPKFPVNGTPAEQAANLRQWGCGGCARAADAIESYAARLAEAVAALREIAKAEGRFSTDLLTHAANTIEDMQQIAVNALRTADSASEQETVK